MPGGAIADFLTHLASWRTRSSGPTGRSARPGRSGRPVRRCPCDEFRALVDAERGTALLGFSANTRPDAFWLRVYGDEDAGGGQPVRDPADGRPGAGRPKPLRPSATAWTRRGGAAGGVREPPRKLTAGPGAYEGLWEFLARTYGPSAGRRAADHDRQVVEVNRLVADLTSGESRF